MLVQAGQMLSISSLLLSISVVVVVLTAYGHATCTFDQHVPLFKPCVATCGQYLQSSSYPHLEECLPGSSQDRFNKDKECFCKSEMLQTKLLAPDEKCVFTFQCQRYMKQLEMEERGDQEDDGLNDEPTTKGDEYREYDDD